MIVLSVFSGCGGMDLGFRQAGFTFRKAVDSDPDACDTYATNLGDHVECMDITRVGATKLPPCEVVIGGPPCQGFSRAGKMDPDDPRNELVGEFVRVVRDAKPVAFCMENVPHLLESPRWVSVREGLVREFRRLGYDVSTAVLDASEFGVPQQRVRAFLFGSRVGPAAGLVPRPTGGPPLTVRQALATLPPYGKPGNDALCNAKITPAKKPVMRLSPYAGMLFNGQGRPINLDATANTLPASMGGNKTPIIDQLALETGCQHWVEEYHASLMKGGKPCKKVPDRLRRLTVQEAACLQGFPAGFTFCGSQCAQFRQIGNALPPPLARAIAEAMKLALTGARPAPAAARRTPPCGGVAPTPGRTAAGSGPRR